jgi:hypothetical protein
MAAIIGPPNAARSRSGFSTTLKEMRLRMHISESSRRAIVLWMAMFALYNANGREIGTYDSQPPKFTALAIAQHHTTALDTYVDRLPQLGERPGFVRDRHGHWRSAYPPVPGLIAGLAGLVLGSLGLWDPAAALAGPAIAKLTASALTALAVVLIYLTARRLSDPRHALLIAVGAGLGTNLWAQTSQTLWQGETAISALAAAVYLSLRGPSSTAVVAAASLALGVAATTRLQLLPAVLVVATMIAWTTGKHVATLLPLILSGTALVALNLHWFGNPLGARLQIEAASIADHFVTGSVGNPLVGLTGLLVSPSRGLLVFSPIVLVAAAGCWRLRRANSDLRWFAVAAVIQIGVYSAYSVWWGGHSYGPRLLLDVVPLLAPLAAVGLPWWTSMRSRTFVAWALLGWSVTVAATGAFVFPHERWNTSPTNVDRFHERLWDWRDPQFVRAWRAGLSPQNFQILKREAFRASRPTAAECEPLCEGTLATAGAIGLARARARD